MVWINEKKTNH